jgi:RNA polymerase-binding protein DksA
VLIAADPRVPGRDRRPSMTRKQTEEDRKRFDVLNHLLRDRQSEIQAKLRSLREVLPAELTQVKDAEEQSVSDFMQGMEFAIMEMESATLRRIDEALLRLQDGTYGVCSECDEEISEARLKALPFAVLCRDCQEGVEDAEAARSAKPSRFFEDAPPATEPRGRRRTASEKPAPSYNITRNAERKETGTIRAPKPARVAR